MSIFRKLGERRVVQIGLSYAAGAWVVLEVADQLADRAIVPEMFYRLVLIWVLFGIPAALLIGWHHGEKGKQKAPLSEIAALIVIAVFALGMSASSVSQQRAMQRQAAAADNPLSQRSIAVLYLDDRTPGQEYQYLADAVTEDLISELSQVPGLRVVSRNGSALFRGSEAPFDSIARVLGAGTLIEGTLDRRGSLLRISLGIVDGQSGNPWRNRATFNVDAAQGLSVRDSVSSQAARLLREWIGEGVRIQQTAAGTRSTGAWSLVQQAEKLRKDAEQAISERDMERAVALFDEADSLLVTAAGIDRDWSEPHVARAGLSYRRSRLLQGSPQAALPFVDAAVAHANEALRRENMMARALELRGTSNYFKWLMKVVQDPREADALFASAQNDLESAVKMDPLLASAHATLSHLYSRNDITNTVLAAQRALEADAFLEVADVVIWRLFTGSLDLGNFTQAQQWCEEGSRRMPDDYRFAGCRLRLMITPVVEAPPIDSAWAILARQDSFTPAPRAEFERIQGEMFVAGAIARAARAAERAGGVLPLQLHDSATAVLQRASSRATQEVDPTRQLLTMEAYITLLLGDRERAVSLLEQRIAADPQMRERWRGVTSWWWRDLESHPRYREMVGLR